MDALTLVLLLIFRSLVVLLPIVVGGLAFRRLAISTSSNAWIYAVTCLFAAVTTAGLLPWAFGMGASNWIFFVLAAFSPGLWFGITLICDVSRKNGYSREAAEVSTILFKANRKAPLEPLVLNDPVVDEPVPVFSHHRPTLKKASAPAPLVLTAKERAPKAVPAKPIASEAREKTIVDVARAMRRNRSTEDRRPKLLPGTTLKDLPFIKSPGTV